MHSKNPYLEDFSCPFISLEGERMSQNYKCPQHYSFQSPRHVGREQEVGVTSPVKAEQRGRDCEAGISYDLDQPGQTFSSHAAQQGTDIFQRTQQESQRWGTELLRPQRATDTCLTLQSHRLDYTDFTIG